MRLTPDLQKKAAAVTAFVLVAGGILYFELRDDSPTPAAAPVTVATPSVRPAATTTGPQAKAIGTTSAAMDPTLRMEPMLVTESLAYSGSGRNIFSYSSAPVEMPKPIAPARPKGSVVAAAALMPAGPPPPPPIDLKFFGTETNQNGVRKAFLLHGSDVFLAVDGDIVQRRYKVISVAANSVLVEDLSDNNRQTLPLIGH